MLLLKSSDTVPLVFKSLASAMLKSRRNPLSLLRRQDTKNRQNSIDDLDEYTTQELQLKAKYVFEQAQLLYDEMLGAGVAKECARDVLPCSSPTKLYMNGTLRSWMHYIDLRSANGTQYEHNN